MNFKLHWASIMQKHGSEDESQPSVIDPPVWDVPLDEKSTHTQCGSQADCERYCAEEPRKSKCCTSKMLCTLLTFLIVVLIATWIGFANFPATRRLALVIILPVLSVAFLCCLITCCCCTTDVDEDLAVIEIEACHLHVHTPKKRENKSNDEECVNGDTFSETSLDVELEDEGKYDFFTKRMPDFSNFLQSAQSSFEESRNYFIGRVFRPATTLCRPSTPIRCRSTGALSALSLSHAKTGNDIECCVDVHCLRDEHGAINLTGTYKLVHNQNFDGFLKVLQIPALFRKAANATRPIHTYTHKGDKFRVQIDGIVKGDSKFVIDGPPTESTLRVIKFLDHVSYLEDKRGIVVRKVVQNVQKKSPTTASEIIVTRELSKNGKKMVLTSTALHSDGSEIAIAVQTFNRISY